MRGSDKAKIRQRRIVHGFLLFLSFSLMFVGKADITAVDKLRMSSNDFLGPIVDVVSAPIRGIETMVEGMRTVASLRAENVRLKGENELLKRWRRRAEILESENRQLRSVSGATAIENRLPVTARAVATPGEHSRIRYLRWVVIRELNATIQLQPDGLIGVVIDVGRSYSEFC